MVKFFGKPNKEVLNPAGKIVFRFDNKGEFFTDEPSLIERAKTAFDYIEMEEPKTIGKKVVVAVKETPITITTKAV
jgi:uncharacterized protein with ATP-grasp and redox domains